MREVKFRAWHNHLERMFMPAFKTWNGGVEVWRDNKQQTAVIDLCGETDSEDVYLMQYTGLKDKNGKEIYEGDIVKILYTDWSSCTGCHKSPQEHMDAIAKIKVVVWSVNGFYVSHKVDGYTESMEPGRHGFIEVIGNVYQDSHLIDNPNA